MYYGLFQRIEAITIRMLSTIINAIVNRKWIRYTNCRDTLDFRYEQIGPHVAYLVIM